MRYLPLRNLWTLVDCTEIQVNSCTSYFGSKVGSFSWRTILFGYYILQGGDWTFFWNTYYCPIIKRAARCTKHPVYAGSGEGPHPEGWIVGGLTYFQWPIPRLEPVTFKSHGTPLTSVPRLPFCLLTSMHTTISNLKSNLKIPLTIIGKIATSASPHPHILIWIRKPGYDATSMLIVSSGRSTRPNQLHLNHSIIYMTTILSMTLSGRILNSVGPSKQCAP